MLAHCSLAKQVGIASWYGPSGHRTASGERYSSNKLTAAHNHLPFGTRVKVVDLRTHRSVVVTITDRGGFGKYHRIIDLSKRAATRLHMRWIDRVRLSVVGHEKLRGLK